MGVVYHAITPGDHFSPRTGSAIPTVVDGLATASSSDAEYEHVVLLDRGTFSPRYPSAGVIEYSGVGLPSRTDRALDLARSRLGLPRIAARRSYRPLVDALSRERPGVVVAHNAPALPAMLTRSGHACVYYAHNDLPRGMSKREASRTLGHAAAIIAVSDDLAERITTRIDPLLHDRVRVVENGVDVQAFHGTTTDRSPGAIRVMFVGRIVPDKGPDVLLRAAALLDRADLEYVIVGSRGFDAGAQLSAYENDLRAIAVRVRGGVSFAPFTDRSGLPPLLRGADVFVAPARWAEPSGLTVSEAMATGLAVIASDVGGIPEVLGGAGVLIPPDDAERLARELASLADDPALRRNLGIRARRRAEERSWERSWFQLRGVLDEVTARV